MVLLPGSFDVVPERSVSSPGGETAAVRWPQQSEKSASLLVVHAVPTREPEGWKKEKRFKFSNVLTAVSGHKSIFLFVSQ
tara:strand:+ start:216 stop:455 length:240 start_codon:yes stop_codon:yes gene_type:complete